MQEIGDGLYVNSLVLGRIRSSESESYRQGKVSTEKTEIETMMSFVLYVQASI